MNTDRVLTIALATAALAMAGSVVYRTVVPPVPPSAIGPAGSTQAARTIPVWREVLPFAIRTAGSANAPVSIVEFPDLECPACKGFQPVLDEVVSKYQEEVALYYVAFPLSIHRFAFQSARAVECADASGQAKDLIRTLLSSQDSLGLVGWAELAGRAGIRDTVRIAECAVAPAEMARIEAGIKFAADNGVVATPTVWINGIEFRGGLPLGVIDSLVSKLARDVRTNAGGQ